MSFLIGLSYTDPPDLSMKRVEYFRQNSEVRRMLSLLKGKPVSEIDIKRDVLGRPYLQEQDIDFNISHSGNLAAISVVKGKNHTGCDVEKLRPRANMEKIAREYFSAGETDFLFRKGNMDEIGFYEIWTLKECYLKLKGLSVFDISSVPSFIIDREFAFNCGVSSPFFFNIFELSGLYEKYIMAAVIEGDEITPEIKWFSQSSLACKKRAEIKAAPSPAHIVSPKR